MNKQELITRNAGVKLYDLSDRDDMHRMNMNLNYCIKNNKEPSFKLIAPFGHELKYDADFYYFESENTPISEQILKEMGFDDYKDTDFYEKYIINIRIVYYAGSKCLRINDYEKNLNANQLHQLIELLK